MSDFQTKEQFKSEFYVEFEKLISSKNENSFYMSETEYNRIFSEVQVAKQAKLNDEKLTEIQTRRLNRFDIAFDRLVAKKEGN